MSPIDWVSKLRRRFIQKILNFFHAEIECRQPPKIGCVYRHSPHTSAQCDTLVLGGIWRQFGSTKTGFLPKTAPEYSGSLHDLMATLSLAFSKLPYLDSNHKGCNPAGKFAVLGAGLKTRRDQCQRVLRPHYKERMDAHRARSGLPQKSNAAMYR